MKEQTAETEGKTEQTEDLAEKGRMALEENNDSLARLKGMNELFNELRTFIFNGLRSKTGEIFFLGKEQIDLVTWYDKPEMTSTELNRSPILNDPDLKDTKHCFLLAPDKGSEIESIFIKNGHKVDHFPSGRGFHGELGGLRMTFLYPDKFMRQEKALDTPKEENVVGEAANTDQVEEAMPKVA